MTRMIWHGGAKAVLTVLALVSAAVAQTVPDSIEGHLAAGKNAGSDKRRSPNCVGQNVSPPLAWHNPPAGTKSYALLMFDPEGRAPAGVTCWRPGPREAGGPGGARPAR